MQTRVKLSIYFAWMINLTPLLATLTISPLSPRYWQPIIEKQAHLGETGDALMALGQRDPLLFGDLISNVLREGFKRFPHSFAHENKELIAFILQEFEIRKEAGFREGILSTAPLMLLPLQRVISKIELNFLIAINPKQLRLRKREIKLWIILTRPLTSSRETFLLLEEKTEDPSIRHFLRQATKPIR